MSIRDPKSSSSFNKVAAEGLISSPAETAPVCPYCHHVMTYDPVEVEAESAVNLRARWVCGRCEVVIHAAPSAPVASALSSPASQRVRCNASKPLSEFGRCGRWKGHEGPHREMCEIEGWNDDGSKVPAINPLMCEPPAIFATVTDGGYAHAATGMPYSGTIASSVGGAFDSLAEVSSPARPQLKALVKEIRTELDAIDAANEAAGDLFYVPSSQVSMWLTRIEALAEGAPSSTTPAQEQKS